VPSAQNKNSDQKNTVRWDLNTFPPEVRRGI